MRLKDKKEILYNMQLIRMVEESIALKYSENKMRCPTHLCIGQEATASVVGNLLNKKDYVVGTHRSHGQYISKGGNINSMIAEIYGKSGGCSKGYGGSMHLIDLNVNFMCSTAIVGNSLPIGAGLGMACKLNKNKNICCIYLGDGCLEEGVFYETVNFCALKKLPVLFICENNLYSVYSPLNVRQPKNRKIMDLVNGMGIKSFEIDGNDVEKIYHSLFTGIKKIRSNAGPLFYCFNTYRWLEHCGPNYDNEIGYRSTEEYNLWKKKDPIKKYKKKLLNKNYLTENELEKNYKKISNIIKKAFIFAESSPYPRSNDAFKNLFYKNE